MVKKLKILIIDDHPLFRKGMISILEKYKLAEKIFEGGDIITAEEIIKREDIDLVTLDLNLPDEDGIRFLNNHIDRTFKILVITAYNSSFLINEVLKKGADGYIKKENLYENLIDGIECVINGGIYVDENNCNICDDLTIDEKSSRYFSLTQAEKEVFKLLAQGKNPKEIATILKKSYKTVENQKKSIMSKMFIKSELELFRVAIRLNLANL